MATTKVVTKLEASDLWSQGHHRPYKPHKLVLTINAYFSPHGGALVAEGALVTVEVIVAMVEAELCLLGVTKVKVTKAVEALTKEDRISSS